MTRYDPYSYGQVNLGGAKKAAAATPDDILFAEAETPPKKGPAADSSWELLDADVTSLLPNATAPDQAVEFGAEILGETAPEAPPAPKARPRAAPVPKRPAAAAKLALPVGPLVAGQVQRTVGARPMAEVAAAPPEAVEVPAPRKQMITRPAPRPGLPRGARLSSTLVPAALFAGGGTGAAWLYAMQQNLVLAGIVGALSLVGAAFTWVWLRS